MPTEKKEKDKKLKKASKKGATPAVVEVLDAKPDSAAEALASGYVSSSEGSLGEDQTTDSQLTQARSPSPGTPSEDIQEPSFSPQQEYIAYETKKNKDKKEKKKSKDKKKDKKKTEIVGGSVSSATPPQSPTSPKSTQAILETSWSAHLGAHCHWKDTMLTFLANSITETPPSPRTAIVEGKFEIYEF